MSKLTHTIKKSELPPDTTLEQATADFVNSIPPDLFSFDKIEMTEDESIIEYHPILVKLMGEHAASFNQAIIESLKDDPQPSDLIDTSVKPIPLPADIQGRIAEYHQAVVECLQDPTDEAIVAYHGLVAGSDDILDHHDKLFEKGDDNELEKKEETSEVCP